LSGGPRPVGRPPPFFPESTLAFTTPAVSLSPSVMYRVDRGASAIWFLSEAQERRAELARGKDLFPATCSARHETLTTSDRTAPHERRGVIIALHPGRSIMFPRASVQRTGAPPGARTAARRTAVARGQAGRSGFTLIELLVVI